MTAVAAMAAICNNNMRQYVILMNMFARKSDPPLTAVEHMQQGDDEGARRAKAAVRRVCRVQCAAHLACSVGHVKSRARFSPSHDCCSGGKLVAWRAEKLQLARKPVVGAGSRMRRTHGRDGSLSVETLPSHKSRSHNGGRAGDACEHAAVPV